jgi:hypothetical protein
MARKEKPLGTEYRTAQWGFNQILQSGDMATTIPPPKCLLAHPILAHFTGVKAGGFSQLKAIESSRFLYA